MLVPCAVRRNPKRQCRQPEPLLDPPALPSTTGPLPASVRNSIAARRPAKAPKPMPLTAPTPPTLAHATTFHQFSAATTTHSVQAALLEWYALNQRRLPWRIPYDPVLAPSDTKPQSLDPQRAYEVWVSEIMLQQTQVKTVIGYYHRWMDAFPTIQALADAPLEQVYEIWAGLGYYSRARRLHEGAQHVCRALQGQLPSQPDVLLREVPGVGRYTAGAIASIAYGQPAELVDGNVIRVLTRWLAFSGDTTRASGVQWTWQAAQQLLDRSVPGHWNQALMELGATLCTPTQPRCAQCPVKPWCKAYQQMHRPTQFAQEAQSSLEAPEIEECHLCLPLDPSLDKSIITQYPRKQPKKPPREEDCDVYIIEKPPTHHAQDPTYLLVKRPSEGLLANLWEPLTIEALNASECLAGQANSSSSTSSRAFSSIVISRLSAFTGDNPCFSDATEFAARHPGAVLVGSVVHVFSHIRKTYRVHHIRLDNDHASTQLIDEPPHSCNGEDDKHDPQLLAHARQSLDSSLARSFIWVSATELSTMAIATASKKAFKLLNDWKAQRSSKSPKHLARKRPRSTTATKPKPNATLDHFFATK
ncbi:hypothetical protein H4R34_002562 [Dimargaris verticillata]|uniref:Adenine DNA glycosylase n=1 Tax=Dimargaris verticillata TaxID=2761393 RepID=A0A9W8EDF9_9FUNG|nr:hypothetical protein H4R34_002562 [Dimargaris verticillata]